MFVLIFVHEQHYFWNQVTLYSVHEIDHVTKEVVVLHFSTHINSE